MAVAKNKVCLIVIDGFGCAPESPNNAISSKNTPCITKMKKEADYYGELEAAGLAVGLPEGVMGNSEVGHLTIGAGAPLLTDIVKINKTIEDKELDSLPEIKRLVSDYKEGRTLHFVGMASEASVHSHLDHLLQILSLLLAQPSQQKSKPPVFLHLITDGRDTPPRSCKAFLGKVGEFMAAWPGRVQVGSLGGRFYYMDRDNREERIEEAVAAMQGKQETLFSSDQNTLEDLIEGNYSKGVSDEFFPPRHFSKDFSFRAGEGLPPSSAGSGQEYPGSDLEEDSFFFFNFRPDRMRQLVTRLLCLKFAVSSVDDLAAAKGRTGSNKELRANFYTMTSYDSRLEGFVNVVFPPSTVPTCLASVLETEGLRQTHIAETEKYAHVTYFFNGREEKVFEGESRVLVPSNKSVKTYDLAPEMSMEGVARKACEAIAGREDTSFVVVNLAGPDMVGHTGDLEAAQTAVSVADRCVGEVWKTCQENSWSLVVTADHGNAEVMRDEQGNKVTSHTCNRVPVFVCLAEGIRKEFLRNAEFEEEVAKGRKKITLSDVAPTVLEIMGISKERYSLMKGCSLVNCKR